MTGDSVSLLSFSTPLQILLVDLLLGADNALLIGLACRGLPPKQQRQAAAWGVGGAIVLRLLLTTIATSLLTWPLVKFIGALLLFMIALNLAAGQEHGEDENVGAPATVASAAMMVLVADAAMSLDNVVALAAIAQGNFLWLAVGIALSLPLLGYGGIIAAQLLAKAPWLVVFGAALLGWLAGDMAVSDALWDHWAHAQAPALVTLAPVLGAAFVYLNSRLSPRQPRPKRAPRPAPPPQPAPVAAKPKRAPESYVIAGLALLFVVAGGFLAFAIYIGGMD